MESEFRILCNARQACPAVKKVLQELGFVNLKDLPNSPSFDISAKININDDKQSEEVAQKIFKRCGEKIQTIQFTLAH